MALLDYLVIVSIILFQSCSFFIYP